MKSVYLFGAGASYGAEGINPSNPPLGANLLQEVMKASQVARSIASPLAEEFSKSFELGMLELMKDRPLHLVSKLYCEIAKYLLKFEGNNENSYLRIVRKSSNEQSIYFTLNYDLLIEDAFDAYARSEISSGRNPPNFKLGKLHGSANLLPDMGGLVMINPTFSNVGSFGGFPLFHRKRAEAQRILENPHQFMPDMCLYMQGKESLYTSSNTKKLNQDWRTSLQNCDRIYICGVAVNLEDHHIWDGICGNFEKVRYFGTEFDRDGFFALKRKLKSEKSLFNPGGIYALAEHLESRFGTLRDGRLVVDLEES